MHKGEMSDTRAGPSQSDEAASPSSEGERRSLLSLRLGWMPTRAKELRTGRPIANALSAKAIAVRIVAE